MRVLKTLMQTLISSHPCLIRALLEEKLPRTVSTESKKLEIYSGPSTYALLFILKAYCIAGPDLERL